jgi:uncharacterized repeat protein (TIGR02543 family)
LRVTITGVPAGATAKVVVTGPKQSKAKKAKAYSKTLTSSTLLRKLKAGSYTITSSTVPAPGGTAVPSPLSAKVKVKATRQAKASVRYTFAASPIDVFALTYNGNEANGGSPPAAATYPDGATVTVSGNTGSLSRDGFRFTGWNTKADDTGTAYAPAATFTMPGAAVTLFAQWAQATR